MIFGLFGRRKYRERIMRSLDEGMVGMDSILSSVNEMRWRVTGNEDFEGRAEILHCLEDTRFLAEDSLRRMARSRICCGENEFQAAMQMYSPVPGQADLISKRMIELIGMSDRLRQEAMRIKGMSDEMAKAVSDGI